MGASCGTSAADRDRTRTAAASAAAGAVERIDAVCRLTVAGKLAARDLSGWVSDYGVSEAEFRLLWLLFRGSAGVGGGGDARSASERPPTADVYALDQGALAERLAVSAAQVSGAVARLQSRQLIALLRDGGDRRRQLWRLAEAGGKLVGEVLATVAESTDLSLLVPPLTPQRHGPSQNCEGGKMKEAAA